MVHFKIKKDKNSIIKYLVWLCRIVTGIVFIFSGFVKAVDPWGSIYKFDEYFNVLHLQCFHNFVTPIAVFVASYEFVLGILLITGSYRRVSSWLLTLVMIIMTPLTLYLAISNPISDCGCFGEVLVISNWTTFIKNVVLLAMAVFLCLYNKRTRCICEPRLQWFEGGYATLYIVVIAIIGLAIQPIFDFRPFKENTDIIEIINGGEDTTENIKFVYEKNGKQKEYSIDNLPDDTWTFVKRIEPSIKKIKSETPFAIYDLNTDITSDVLLEDGVQTLILVPDDNMEAMSSAYRLNRLKEHNDSINYDMMMLTSMDKKQIEEWVNLTSAQYPIYTVDQSTLRTIARGNPAIVILKDGVVRWKSNFSSIRDLQILNDIYTEIAKTPVNNKSNASLWLLLIAILIVPLAINILFGEGIMHIIRRYRRKNQNKKANFASEKENK